jgi:hypothetical protein
VATPSPDFGAAAKIAPIADFCDEFAGLSGLLEIASFRQRPSADTSSAMDIHRVKNLIRAARSVVNRAS